MMNPRRSLAVAVVSLMVAVAHVATQAQKPTLYLVATAHLDTQWNWTVQDTIRQFVPNTFYTNFKYFEQYPDYTFSWEGAIHYMWFKEYHPEDWAKVQQYVAAGRWRLAGAWMGGVAAARAPARPTPTRRRPNPSPGRRCTASPSSARNSTKSRAIST